MIAVGGSPTIVQLHRFRPRHTPPELLAPLPPDVSDEQREVVRLLETRNLRYELSARLIRTAETAGNELRLFEDGRTIVYALKHVQPSLESVLRERVQQEQLPLSVTTHPAKGYFLVDREEFVEYRGSLRTRQFKIKDVLIGGDLPVIIAGPCTIHSREQTLEIAEAVKAAGAHMLRGGAYKPRTSPYDFQGLEKAGLEILAEARKQTGLPIVTEVMEPELVPVVGEVADVLQIGSRNMQNYALLREAGRYAAIFDKGVLLKTSLMPTLKEVLCAAEYVAVQGAKKIILCERGMAVKSGDSRNTPNPLFLRELREATHFPVFGDPSHSTGDVRYVADTANMYLAARANGLIIEVRRDNEPETIDGAKVCDYKQSLPVAQFKEYMSSLGAL